MKAPIDHDKHEENAERGREATKKESVALLARGLAMVAHAFALAAIEEQSKLFHVAPGKSELRSAATVEATQAASRKTLADHSFSDGLAEHIAEQWQSALAHYAHILDLENTQ